jgi:hypothetical protein
MLLRTLLWHSSGLRVKSELKNAKGGELRLPALFVCARQFTFSASVQRVAQRRLSPVLARDL